MNGNWKKAINSFERARSLDLNNTRLFASLSALYADMGDFEKSIEYIDEAIEIEPNNQLFIRNKLFRLNYMGDAYEDARKKT